MKYFFYLYKNFIDFLIDQVVVVKRLSIVFPIKYLQDFYFEKKQ